MPVTRQAGLINPLHLKRNQNLGFTAASSSKILDKPLTIMQDHNELFIGDFDPQVFNVLCRPVTTKCGGKAVLTVQTAKLGIVSVQHISEFGIL